MHNTFTIRKKKKIINKIKLLMNSQQKHRKMHIKIGKSGLIETGETVLQNFSLKLN